MSPRKRSKRLPKGLGWLIFAAVLGALYHFKPESFWGVCGVLALPLSVYIMIRRARGSKRKDWHPSGQTDEQWAKENDPRNL